MLTPVLVAGFGRSGSTAAMSLLTTDPQVAANRSYALEERLLTYLAKLSLVAAGGSEAAFSAMQMCDFDDRTVGSPPFFRKLSTGSPPSRYELSAGEWLRSFWAGLSRDIRDRHPEAVFYAEKAPAWLPALARSGFPSYTIYLFRDLRDVYLSANSFMRSRQRLAFFRSPEDTDLEYVRRLALECVSFFENYFMDRKRADCLLVRYEDLITRPDAILQDLRRWGLNASREGMDIYLDRHRTTPGSAPSLNRWQTEPVPEEVAKFIEDNLGKEMHCLGYRDTTIPLDGNRFLSFGGPEAETAVLALSADGSIFAAEECSRVTITGGDFWMIPAIAPFDSREVREIWLSVQSGAGDHCSIYWQGDGEDFSEHRCLRQPCRPAAHWQVLRFQLSRHPLWQGRIARLRVDLFNTSRATRASGNGAVRWLRLIS